MVVQTKAVDELMAKRLTEDATWCFSDQEFHFRKHLWTSMTTPMRDVFSTLRTSLVSSTGSKDVLSEIGSEIRALPRHLQFYLSGIHSYLVMALAYVKGSKLKEPTSAKQDNNSSAPETHSAKGHMPRIQVSKPTIIKKKIQSDILDLYVQFNVAINGSYRRGSKGPYILSNVSVVTTCLHHKLGALLTHNTDFLRAYHRGLRGEGYRPAVIYGRIYL